MIIFVIRRNPERWVPWLAVRELHTSSGITNCKVARVILTLALPAPFIFASLDIACHVVAAPIFLGQAVAAGARLEFFKAMLFVQLSNYMVIRHLAVAFLAVMHFQLAFEADYGFAFSTPYLGGLRVWCSHPFLTF